MENRRFGESLVFFRKAKGLKQKELAKMAGITPTALNYYEKNKREPNVLKIKVLAKTLGITGDELLGMSGDGDYGKELLSNTLASLSACESQLLQKFRLLNDVGQKYILRQLDFSLLQPEHKKTGSYRQSAWKNKSENKKSELNSSDLDSNGDP